MLSSGTAASSRSAKVRSTGTGRALATLICLVCARAQHEARIQIGFPPHESTRYFGQRAGVDDEAEPLARGVGNRDEHSVGLRFREYRLDLQQASEHRHSLKPAAGEPLVVVDDPDDLLSGRLAQLAQQASPAAAGADDQGPLAVGAPCQRGDGPHEAALPEA